MKLDQDSVATQDVLHVASALGLGNRTSGSSFFDQMANALSKAVSENAYRSRLMAIAGHDLKQPLQTISLLLEILGLQIADPDAKPHLQKAHRSIKLIAEGLDNLAMASRLDVDRESLRLSHFSISEVLEKLLPAWQEHAAEKCVTMRVARSSAYVTSNFAMLTTILNNLVGNAIKYSPGGRILVGCRRMNSQLSLQVLDTGVGIRPERLAQVFLAFHQEDPSADGLGLGLSIVQRNAAILGHRVRMRSEAGKGSIFSVEVPISLSSTRSVLSPC